MKKNIIRSKNFIKHDLSVPQLTLVINKIGKNLAAMLSDKKNVKLSLFFNLIAHLYKLDVLIRFY